MGSIDFIFTCRGNEQKVFNKNLAILKKHPGKKAVHDLRVTVKKLRAVLELSLLITEKRSNGNALKEMEQLFSILGKQRDIEICLEIIDAVEKDSSKKHPEHKSYFRSLLSIAHSWTRKAVRQYNNKEADVIGIYLESETEFKSAEELKHKIEVIIKTRFAACRNYFNDPHKLRQSLKELYYWIKMIPTSLLQRFKYEKELHDLLDDFGNWQNLNVSERKFRHFRKDYLPKSFPEFEAAKMLEAIIKEKKEKLLKLALRRTNSLLNRVLST